MECVVNAVLFTLLLLNYQTEVIGWPGGTYGIPMPVSGCPNGTNFNWETGSLTQETESGNEVSNPLHLTGSFKDERIKQHFCVKTSLIHDDGSHWMRGQYCIYKKGSCPDGFGSGFIYWDDASSWMGSHLRRQKGSLPDGEYNSNTKIYFCCRGDGKYYKPIQLPAPSPFYLFRYAKKCQQVTGTTVTEEWIMSQDEDSVNMNSAKPPHPIIARPFGEHSTKLYYCYYQPISNKDIGITRTAIIIGIVFVVLCIGCCFAVYMAVVWNRRKLRGATALRFDVSDNRNAPRTYQSQRSHTSEIGVNTDTTCGQEHVLMLGKTGQCEGAVGGEDQPPSYDEVMSIQDNKKNEQCLSADSHTEPIGENSANA